MSSSILYKMNNTNFNKIIYPLPHCRYFSYYTIYTYVGFYNNYECVFLRRLQKYLLGMAFVA